jgi:hypothetical protein
MTALKMQITHWGTVALDRRELRAVMGAAGRDVARKTAALIAQAGGAGRLYYGGGGGAYRGGYRPGQYRASAPGQPPARVTGTLRSSLKVYTYRNGGGFAVRERAFYSLFLEAGARGRGRRVLDPRPHLDRVMKQEEAELNRRIRAALLHGLKWRQTK